ncbi:hypothetical protein DdX_18217 [Ditylenchus destructor]|uniref:Uncharacterized protein n=1 Tax=Ditylenchus destructor TaxID=166010 RepID=A0AAD4MKA6_9BILA|nr:hypothetical protein DdX_18217 [Ditylenchus destructor]
MEVDTIMNDIDAQHAETPSKCDNNQKANPVVPRKDTEIASGYKNKQVPLLPRQLWCITWIRFCKTMYNTENRATRSGTITSRGKSNG